MRTADTKRRLALLGKRMSMIRAVVFDLDDTLYPERAYAWSGFAAVAAAFQDTLRDPARTESRLRELFNSEQRGRVFNALLAERGLPEDPQLVDRLVQTYRTHRPDISLHPDADRVLTQLHGKFKLGLITDGPSESQWAKIDVLKLRSRLNEIIVTSDLIPECPKPDPRAFEVMAERLDVEPNRCVYVGDNPAKDFIAPRSLGWTTIRVLRPGGVYWNEATAPAGIPAFVLQDLHQLGGLLA